MSPLPKDWQNQNTSREECKRTSALENWRPFLLDRRCSQVGACSLTFGRVVHKMVHPTSLGDHPGRPVSCRGFLCVDEKELVVRGHGGLAVELQTVSCS